MAQAREEAGVSAIPLHGARHSYVELALTSGVRLDVVSRAIGHASARFTADQYTHDSDEAEAEAEAEAEGEGGGGGGGGRAHRRRAPVALGKILGKCEGAGRTGPFRLCC